MCVARVSRLNCLPSGILLMDCTTTFPGGAPMMFFLGGEAQPQIPSYHLASNLLFARLR